MNSDEERVLLESWGWVQDLVGRKWIAPDGFEVSLDDLVIAAAAMGAEMEHRLREIAQAHGRRRTA